MNDEIRLTFRLSDVPEVQWTGLLGQRYFGRGAGLWVVAVAGGVTAVLMVLIATGVLGYVDIRSLVFGVVIASLALALAGLVNRVLGRRMLRDTLAAPFRHEAVTYTIHAEGIMRPNAVVPWRWIIEVVEVPGATLLLLSPREFLPLPHDRIEGDVTPEEMRRRIDAWRATAG